MSFVICVQISVVMLRAMMVFMVFVSIFILYDFACIFISHCFLDFVLLGWTKCLCLGLSFSNNIFNLSLSLLFLKVPFVLIEALKRNISSANCPSICLMFYSYLYLDCNILCDESCFLSRAFLFFNYFAVIQLNGVGLSPLPSQNSIEC